MTALNEQETTVTMMRDEYYATVYTSDTLMMHKFEKFPQWKTYSVDGKIVGVSYKIPKKLISFRSKLISRTMSEEQRQAAAERLRKARAKHD